MTTVYKYHIKHGLNQLNLPFGAQILTAQIQLNQLVLWALVDPSKPTTQRKLIVEGTGQPIQWAASQLTYISTFQLYGGAEIYHVFEVKE